MLVRRGLPRLVRLNPDVVHVLTNIIHCGRVAAAGVSKNRAVAMDRSGVICGTDAAVFSQTHLAQATGNVS